MIPALIAAAVGAAIILWTAGTRMLNPVEVGWVMRGDWQIHFLGWQFFRHEPWHVPPGLTPGLLEPIGTSLGYTDAIPLMAFALKPFADALPNPFQYLGLWFVICFSLQGFFGALLVSTWSPRPLMQIAGALLFIFFPTLLARIAHPALCAHWLLLWALWLNWRRDARRRVDYAQHLALGLVSGLIHPYLAVMVLALLLALAVSRSLALRGAGAVRALTAFGIAATAVIAGWWASGLLTVASPATLAAEIGGYSMNLLAVVNPGPRTYLLPPIEVLSVDQLGEGFQYFGAGVLCLCATALALAIVRRPFARAAIPLTVVLAVLAFYSLLPQISVGTHVLLDLSASVNPFIGVFRSTGRFFWPAAYALLAIAIGLVAQLPRRIAAPVLVATVALQLVDVHRTWLGMHAGSRTEEFLSWDMPLPSHEWEVLLPGYRRLRLYYPAFCGGPVAAPAAAAAFKASLHGLAINDGFAARVPRDRLLAACRGFIDDFTSGRVDAGTVYLLAPALMPDFMSRLGDAVVCREIDGVGVCTKRGAQS